MSGAGSAAPAGFSSGGAGLSSLYGGGGGGGFGGGGPPPGEPPPPPGKLMGTAKRWNMEKGFGFIVPDGGGDDMFVHANALLDGNALRDGARVCYRKSFDHAKNKDRAEEVTGAYTDPSRPPPRPPPGGMGGGFGGGMGGG